MEAAATDMTAPHCCCFSDIPVEPMAQIASYLVVPSQASLAVAIDYDFFSLLRGAQYVSPQSMQVSNGLPALAGDQGGIHSGELEEDHRWDGTLDFGDVEKDLAVKLSDGDIQAILLHIDAVNHVKKLIVTNCISITGIGLGPLRGSTIIEQIDLSLVAKHESPILDPAPPISREHVLPILDSIINMEGCKLKLLQLPKAWRECQAREGKFYEFLSSFDSLLKNRDAALTCLRCNGNLPQDELMCTKLGGFGMQEDICYGCTKHYCDDWGNSDCNFVSSCGQCERKYCGECVAIGRCKSCEYAYCVDVCKQFTDCSGNGCNEKVCNDCVEHKSCTKCNKVMCAVCLEHGEWEDSCANCSVRYCVECNAEEGANGVYYCDCSQHSLCGGCRVSWHSEDYSFHCKSCLKKVVSILSAKKKKLQQENDALKTEIRTLKEGSKVQSVDECQREKVGDCCGCAKSDVLQQENDDLKNEIKVLKRDMEVLMIQCQKNQAAFISFLINKNKRLQQENEKLKGEIKIMREK